MCNPAYIDNLVDLIVSALGKGEALGEAFIGADGIGVEWREFYAYYARMANKRLKRMPYLPARLGGAASVLYEKLTGRPGPISRTSVAFYSHRTVFDVHKNEELLGHKPRVSFEEGMRRTEDWLRGEKLA